MSIDPRFLVELKGKTYPLYQGVLDAATNAGLRGLKTTIVQIPTPENNHMAVVLVRAEFEDGRVFESVGDASPANCSANIATAALRMAETRAGGCRQGKRAMSGDFLLSLLVTALIAWLAWASMMIQGDDQ